MPTPDGLHMDLDACFTHPLWPAFKHYLLTTGPWQERWIFADCESYWRPWWHCFLAGAATQFEEGTHR
jgi:hypothetical protein